MHNLVFTGQILDGFSTEQVRSQLLGMLKLPTEEAHRVFSGNPVVLKRNLDANDAQRYLKHLNSLGIGIQIEPPIGGASPFPTLIIDEAPVPFVPPTAPAAKPEEKPSSAPTPTTPPALVAQEEVVCPKCSERQPKRTLCRACATDIPRFLAAQEAVDAEIRAARLEAKEGKTAPTKQAGDHNEESIELAPTPAWFGLSFDGRFGRLSYLWAGSTALLLLSLGTSIGLKTTNFGLITFFIIVTVLISLRYTALRCHDTGWSGWLSLVLFIPYIGSLFSLILLILPGDKRDNQFGPPPVQAGRNAAIIGLIALLVSGALWTSNMKEAMRLAGKYMGQSQVQVPQNKILDDAPLVPGSYSASNQVLIYHIDHSDPDSERLESGLKLLGVTPRMVDMPTEGPELEAMLRQLHEAGYKLEQLALPIVEANGTLVPNSPSLQEVAQHLKKN